MSQNPGHTDVTQEITTDPWQTAIRVAGDFGRVADFVEDYMRRFCPSTFRTKVVRREELPDGRWQFIITRDNHCD